jgi:hypothetical protein
MELMFTEGSVLAALASDRPDVVPTAQTSLRVPRPGRAQPSTGRRSSGRPGCPMRRPAEG